MSTIKINNITCDNTLKAFQPFYDKPLTIDDAIEIKKNLYGIFELLSRAQREISNNRSL